MVDTSGSFFGDTIATFEHFRVFLVNKRCQIPTVVQNQVEGLAIFECNQLLLKTPIILFFGFSFPCKDWDPCCCDCSSGVILRREDIARSPGNLLYMRTET